MPKAVGRCLGRSVFVDTLLRVSEKTVAEMDRRVIRTREALQRALMALIAQRTYDDISVGDICRVAKVARSTFYTHYTGKDDLKRAGLRDHGNGFSFRRPARHWRTRVQPADVPARSGPHPPLPRDLVSDTPTAWRRERSTSLRWRHPSGERQ